ncbi:MAG: hypothetical protein A4E66_02550 [Syntrophus sp. PtaB.Bin001]|nr:MAG: hypothetical protein A4E66_02550 [Syntrophus sp. PtaB.Bin001]
MFRLGPRNLFRQDEMMDGAKAVPWNDLLVREFGSVTGQIAVRNHEDTPGILQAVYYLDRIR